MKFTMALFCAAAAFIAVATTLGHPQRARAEEAPWCAIKGEGYWDCQYRSAEDCVQRAGRGFCTQNPRYHGAERPTAKKRDSRRHRPR
jgi:Protein of unknown function (DUF3551)